MDGDVTLNRLFEHIRATDAKYEKMVSQIDKIATTLGRPVRGPSSVSPTVEPPTTPVQQTPRKQKRFRGPPGTFRPSVPETVHKSVELTQFHISLFSPKSSMLTSMLVKGENGVPRITFQG